METEKRSSITYQHQREAARVSDRLQELYAQWGQMYAAIKRASGSVHNNAQLAAIEENIANLEADLREELGISLRFDNVPAGFNVFSAELRLVEKIMAKEDVTRVCLYSGPSGAVAVHCIDTEENTHAIIRERVWGSSDENCVRPPSTSGRILTVANKNFIVLDTDRADMLWPSTHFGTMGAYKVATIPVISMDNEMVGAVPQVYSANSTIAETIKSHAENTAYITTAYFELLRIEKNNMQLRLDKNARGSRH